MLGHCGTTKLYDTIQARFAGKKFRTLCKAYQCPDQCERYKLLGQGYGKLPPRHVSIAPWNEGCKSKTNQAPTSDSSSKTAGSHGIQDKPMRTRQWWRVHWLEIPRASITIRYQRCPNYGKESAVKCNLRTNASNNWQYITHRRLHKSTDQR